MGKNDNRGISRRTSLNLLGDCIIYKGEYSSFCYLSRLSILKGLKEMARSAVLLENSHANVGPDYRVQGYWFGGRREPPTLTLYVDITI